MVLLNMIASNNESLKPIHLIVVQDFSCFSCINKWDLAVQRQFLAFSRLHNGRFFSRTHKKKSRKHLKSPKAPQTPVVKANEF